MNIAAGVVLYNPENIERLDFCLKNAINQFEVLYVFDNCTQNIDLKRYDNIHYISENRNCGLAYALNRIMKQAKDDGFDWVVTLDQDSIIPNGLIDGYKKAIDENDNKLGIVCPQIVDNRRTYMQIITNPIEEYVEFSITSASCTSVKAWENIGRFDEWLFIDLIDNDFCKRLIVSGYKILRLNSFVLNQEFGKIIPKKENIQKFWIGVSKIFHNENFAKFSYIKYVSPRRVYYTCRNIIYVNKKLSDFGVVGYKENYNCNTYIGFIICFVLPSYLRANCKNKVFKSIIKGTYEGIKTTPPKWNKPISNV